MIGYLPHKKRWVAYTTGEKARTLLRAAGQIVLTGAAGRDMLRRPAAQIRGSKSGGAALAWIAGVEPLAYVLCGRRPLPHGGCCSKSIYQET